MRALLLLLAIAVVGCSHQAAEREAEPNKPGDEFVGQWFGRFELS
jgi:hypothetical protein